MFPSQMQRKKTTVIKITADSKRPHEQRGARSEQRGQQPAMEVKTPSGGSQKDTRPPAVLLKHGSVSFCERIFSGATFASFISPLGVNVSPSSKSFDVYCHSNVFKKKAFKHQLF